MEPLTPSELRALYLLARFETATEAAEFAGLQPQTIRNQLHRAFAKLGVNGRLEAFRKLGWLRPPPFMPGPDDPGIPARVREEDEEDPPQRIFAEALGEDLTRPHIEVFYRQRSTSSKTDGLAKGNRA